MGVTTVNGVDPEVSERGRAEVVRADVYREQEAALERLSDQLARRPAASLAGLMEEPQNAHGADLLLGTIAPSPGRARCCQCMVLPFFS
jgi:hypothetical protein